MTAEQQRKRRVLIAIVAAVAMIGAVGVTISLLVDDDARPAGGPTAPGVSVDPLSVEGQCRSAEVVQFDVTADPKASPEFTATGATAPWVLKGETSQTISTGEDSKLVTISKPGSLPRVVLKVDKGTSGWRVVETSGCLEASSGERACTQEHLTVGKAVYSRTSDTTQTPTAGGYVGTGSLDSCPVLVGGRQVAPRGVIAPVSVFAAQGQPGAVVVSNAEGSHRFAR